MGKQVHIYSDKNASGRYSMWGLGGNRRHDSDDEDPASGRAFAWRLPDRKRQNAEQNLAATKPYPKGQEIIRPFEEPNQIGEPIWWFSTGIWERKKQLRKISGKESLSFSGLTRVLESEEETSLRRSWTTRSKKGMSSRHPL